MFGSNYIFITDIMTEYNDVFMTRAFVKVNIIYDTFSIKKREKKIPFGEMFFFFKTSGDGHWASSFINAIFL